MSKLIFLDVETTGVEDTDYLCQVGYKFGDEIKESLFKPPNPIGIQAMSVNHITNEMLEDKPAFKGSDFAKELQEKFIDDCVLIAHNANFDRGFLLREDMVLPSRFVCTMKLAHEYDKDAIFEKHNLQYLRYFFKLKFDFKVNPHEAVNDVLVLEQLYKFFCDHFTLDQMIEISSKPILLKRMQFGKYKGEFWKDVAEKDFDYLLWMRKTLKMNENLEFTLDYYLDKYKNAKKK